jgi:Phage tail lysozyme
MGFLFGGNTGETPETLKRQRDIADALAGQIGHATTVGGGIGDILRGIGVGVSRYRADSKEGGLRSGAPKFSLADVLSGGKSPVPVAANIPNAPTAEPMGTSMQGFGSDQTGTMVAQRLEKDFGLSPAAAAGFAGNLAHESGNFKTLQEINPTVAGSRGGFGWAQWTGPRRKQFESWASQNGLDPASPEANYGFLKNELQGSEGGVLAKLQGVTDPAVAAQIVSQNYLRPGIPHMDSRIQYANKIAQGLGQQVASNDPKGAFAIPQPASFLPEQTGGSFAPPQQPVVAPQMAQAAPTNIQPQQAPQMTQASPEMIAKAQAALQNPWTDDTSKAMAQHYLEMVMKQQQDAQDPLRQIQMQAAQQGLDKGAIELNQLRNPAPPKPIEVGGRLLDPITYKPVYEPPSVPDKPTANIQDYNFYADNEKAAGRVPLGPLQYEQEIKKAGASNVTTNVGGAPGDDELRKKLQGKEGESWAGYADSATVSGGTMQDMQVLDELVTLAPQGPITGRLAAAFPGVSSAADAFQSIVKRVAPTLRAPGSGSTSDIEYDGMLKSLPSLSNQPEANSMISQIMKAKAQINIERGQIVSAYSNGEIDAPSARKQMNEINKRSIMSPEMKKALLGLGSETKNQGQTKSGVKWKVEP